MKAKGAFAPMFSTTLGRSNIVTPPSNFLLGDRGVDVNDWFSSTGVRQRLTWGSGTWSVSWDAARTTTNNPLTSFDPSLQSGVQVAFSQPLLRGPADRRGAAAVHRREAESGELRAALPRIGRADRRRREAGALTLKATIANVTVQQRSLELAQELARQNKIRVEAGQMPPLDLVQSEAEVAQRRENLIRANTAAADAEDALRRLIIDPADDGVLEDPSRSGPTRRSAARRCPTSTRRSHRRSTADTISHARSKDLDNAKTNVDFLRNQRLPDVRLETSYRGSGLAGTQLVRTGAFPGVITGSLNRGLGDALGQAFTPDYPTWSFGVTVNYPLGHSYEDANYARARGRAEAGGAADREPAGADRRDDPAGRRGRFAARSNVSTRRAPARRCRSNACSPSSAVSKSDCRRRSS